MLTLSVMCSTDLRLNQPRYATLPNIMKAKSKPIKKYTPEELNVEIKSDLEVVQVTEPPKRKAGVILSSIDELIDKLKSEAHVIWKVLTSLKNGLSWFTTSQIIDDAEVKLKGLQKWKSLNFLFNKVFRNPCLAFSYVLYFLKGWYHSPFGESHNWVFWWVSCSTVWFSHFIF